LNLKLTAQLSDVCCGYHQGVRGLMAQVKIFSNFVYDTICWSLKWTGERSSMPYGGLCVVSW